MKILFARPRPSNETIGLQHVMVVEPLELETLAALAAPSDQVVIVDMIMEKKPFRHFLERERPDVLCLTGYITDVPGMIQCARLAKELHPRVTVIAGGVHCEVCPGDLDDPAIDYRVVRNASSAFRPLLERVRTGEGPVPEGVFVPGDNPADKKLPEHAFHSPLPRRELTERYRKGYFYIFHHPVALIKTAFGCPYRCSFCFCRKITDDRYAARDMDDVMDELALIKEREVYIVDDDFLSDRARLELFMEECARRKIRKHYLVYGRADFIARNPDIMERMKAAGLRTVIVGFESFSEKDLSLYNKRADARANEEAMRVLNRLGIDCYATMILPPDWDKSDFRECGNRLKKLGIHYVNLQPFTPLPGTDMAANDYPLVIPRSDFEKWDLAHVTVRPSRLSVAEYYGEIMALYQRVLFQPRALLKYLFRYSPAMLWKMLTGSFRVRAQYERKRKEAGNA